MGIIFLLLGIKFLATFIAVLSEYPKYKFLLYGNTAILSMATLIFSILGYFMTALAAGGFALISAVAIGLVHFNGVMSFLFPERSRG